MDFRIEDNILYKFNVLTDRINSLEKELSELKLSIQSNNEITKSHLLRIKNGDELSNDFILNSACYMDLSPEKAWKLYKQEDLDFILIDVSSASYLPIRDIPESKKIPFEDLDSKLLQIPNRSTRIFIISEDGTSSILACKKLHKLGFKNLSNISGGYKFWPEFKQEEKSSSIPLTKIA